MFSRLSSDEGIEGDLTQQEPEAALGGGAGLWKLYEQGSEGECLRLQGVFAQQDRWYQIQYRQVRLKAADSNRKYSMKSIKVTSGKGIVI